MEKTDWASILCTTGVVSCGLAVIMAATVRIIRDILKPHQKINPPLEPQSPIEGDDEPIIRRRRTRSRSITQECEHCHEDLSKVQILRSETTDQKTKIIKECPSCRKESTIEARLLSS